MEAMSMRASSLPLVPVLFLLSACSSNKSPPLQAASEIRVDQSRKEDVLARYGTPDQLILQPDVEVWLYDGRNAPDSLIDVNMRVMAAMAMPGTTRPSTNPAAETRTKAIADAMARMAQMYYRQNGDGREAARFTFERKTGRLRAISGPLPPFSFGKLSNEQR